MHSLKSKCAVSLAVTLVLGSFEANAGIILGTEMAELTVFSYNTTNTGANSTVYGSMLGGDVATTGANAVVHGDITATKAANVGGGTSKVFGNVVSGDVLTVGGATDVASDGPNVSGSITSTGASTIGQNAIIGGDMISGGVTSTGADSYVGGNVLSNGTVSTGNNGDVRGNVSSDGLVSIGAYSDIGGSVYGDTYSISNSNHSTIGAGIAAGPTSPDVTNVRQDVKDEVDLVAQQVKDAQDTLFDMGVGVTTTLASLGMGPTMTVDRTLAAGVYSANSFSTTAGTTLTLRGDLSDNQTWIFNIRDILAFGGTSHIVMENVGANASVYWNAYGTADIDGYISTGDSSHVIGTLLANTYVTVGANATVKATGTSCGAVYSATSYVTAGDSAKIGGLGCSASVTSVPEPESFGMLLAALALLGFKRSRKA
jgi:predicted acyltransferase (DUF342 family)